MYTISVKNSDGSEQYIGHRGDYHEACKLAREWLNSRPSIISAAVSHEGNVVLEIR